MHIPALCTVPGLWCTGATRRQAYSVPALRAVRLMVYRRYAPSGLWCTGATRRQAYGVPALRAVRVGRYPDNGRFSGVVWDEHQ